MIFVIAATLSIGTIFGLLLGLFLATRWPVQPRTFDDLQLMLPKAAIEPVERREYNDVAEEWQDHSELVIYTGWDVDEHGNLIDYETKRRVS